uniref:Uncharacterized protein n=1 Tax=Rhizophora mucronata TaxID=61149 RepID=A0A2P2JJE2_RHIMU
MARFGTNDCSLGSSGDSLVVVFGSRDLGVMLLKKEKFFTHLWFRSIPIQGDDFSCIKAGEASPLWLPVIWD